MEDKLDSREIAFSQIDEENHSDDYELLARRLKNIKEILILLENTL